METMTEEEALALDEHFTINPPKVDPSKARIKIPLVTTEHIDEKTRTKK